MVKSRIFGEILLGSHTTSLTGIMLPLGLLVQQTELPNHDLQNVPSDS